MKPANPFHFKQFSVYQDQCAMRVSTDACLFGAMIPAANISKVLDIGAGTGLLSLMMAQRSPSCSIDAIEIDDIAANQAGENFTQSPWSERLRIRHQDIQSFAEQSGKQYDCIICNPPFFTGHYPSTNDKRHLARHNDSLSFTELSTAIGKMLTSDGKCHILLPVSEQARFTEAMQHQGFALYKEMRVIPATGKPANRCFLSFSRKACTTPASNQIVIHENGGYSADFIQHLRPFYLKL